LVIMPKWRDRRHGWETRAFALPWRIRYRFKFAAFSAIWRAICAAARSAENAYRFG
jgi:hypothetical protein